MASNLAHPFAIYPMVEEHEASGRVAAVYSQALEHMPFVPSLFKSLAVCPPYLVLAWRQAEAAFATEAFGDEARRLAGAVSQAAVAPTETEIRDALAGFVEPLGRMLLLSAGLLAAVEGELFGGPAPATPPEQLDRAARSPSPAQWELNEDELFGRLRLALRTPLVNSIWRTLAERGLLQVAWTHLEPQVDGTAGAASELQADAVGTARRLDWPVVAGPEALDGAGMADGAPGIAVILDAYVKTLPRVLALVASSA